jgi:hypothetical protein
MLTTNTKTSAARIGPERSHSRAPLPRAAKPLGLVPMAAAADRADRVSRPHCHLDSVPPHRINWLRSPYGSPRLAHLNIPSPWSSRAAGVRLPATALPSRDPTL